MPSVELKPYVSGRITSSGWFDSNSIYAGNTPGGAEMAFMAFAIYPYENYKITDISLFIRSPETRTGTVYVGAFQFNGSTIPSGTGTAQTSIYGDNVTISLSSLVPNISNYQPSLGVRINFSASGGTQWLGMYASECYLYLRYETYASAVPDELSPNGVNRNPRAEIPLSWRFNPNTEVTDIQSSSTIRYNVNGGAWTEVNIPGIVNAYTFPANRFADGNTINWQVRTTSSLGTTGWSATATFYLAATPPLQSVLVFPLNVPINGINGVPLEWQYNSPYDTFPSRFDIRYRIDGGAWIVKTNYGSETNPAYQSVMTDPITIQSTVEWQVMAYGQMGDAGPWSEVGTFFTIGPPDPPIIIRVSNSNRPTVYFSSTDLMSWELEITHNNIKIYETGNQAFTGEFTHVTNQFFANGNYLVRMRATNEFGLISDWGSLSFTINTISPEALKLQIISNQNFNMRLHFNNVNAKTVYIYRSELRKNKYLRIGMTKGSVYDDYTARPRQRYEYFVRVVNPDFSFADSNIETGSLSFLQTTIAEHDKPGDMIKLLHQIGGKPTKNISFGFEKSLTQFVGREFPVLQVGNHATKSLSLSFYCTIADYEQLEEMHRSYNVLILRDWRLGSIYGTITGSISANRETDGCIVSFSFSQVDFNEEVELI